MMDIVQNIKYDGICKHFLEAFQKGRGDVADKNAFFII